MVQVLVESHRHTSAVVGLSIGGFLHHTGGGGLVQLVHDCDVLPTVRRLCKWSIVLFCLAFLGLMVTTRRGDCVEIASVQHKKADKVEEVRIKDELLHVP